MMVAMNYDWDPTFDFVAEEVLDTGLRSAVFTQLPLAYGRAVSQVRLNASHFFHFDVVGTTRILTADDQSVAVASVYSAYGERVSLLGTTEASFGFVGQLGYYFLSVVNLLDVRARNYSTKIARWTSVDPLWTGNASVDLIYGYAANSPVSRFDPSGLACDERIRPVPPVPVVPPPISLPPPPKWVNTCWLMCKTHKDAAECRKFCSFLVAKKINSCRELMDYCTQKLRGRRNIEKCLIWYNQICFGDRML